MSGMRISCISKLSLLRNKNSISEKHKLRIKKSPITTIPLIEIIRLFSGFIYSIYFLAIIKILQLKAGVKKAKKV
jgi:hypothetical protein